MRGMYESPSFSFTRFGRFKIHFLDLEASIRTCFVGHRVAWHTRVHYFFSAIIVFINNIYYLENLTT